MKTIQNNKVDLSSILLNASFLLFSTLIIAIITIIGTSPAHAESSSASANASVTVSDTIRLTLTGGDLVINNLTPGTSADSNIITATVTSNSPYGFHLSATTGTKNGTTSLVNTADSNFAFTNLDSNKASLSNFSDNTWGYSYSTNDGTSWVSGDYGTTQTGYNGLALDNDDSGATGTTLFNSDSYTNSTAVKFKIGAKSSSTQASGTYTGIVNFYAVTNPKPIPEMQNLAASECTDTMSQAIDNRDGAVYSIRRLADGNCWMLDNLSLGGDSPISLTPADTNIASDFTLPASNLQSFSWDDINFKTPAIYADNKNEISETHYGIGSGKIGTYYNYCAASGGTVCTPEGGSASDAIYDVCPAGWRLPTGGVNGEYHALCSAYDPSCRTNEASDIEAANTGSLQYNLDLVDSAFIRENSLHSNYGLMAWSSTLYEDSSDQVYFLSAGNNSVAPATPTNYAFDRRVYGRSIRCMLDF